MDRSRGGRSVIDRFTLSVPATSANLGPGFDTLGVALDLRLEATVVPAHAFAIDFTAGPRAPTHDGFRDEIMRGFETALAGRARPAVTVSVENRVPLGMGLGGSAAAVVLGAALAAALYDDPIPSPALARIVTALEGHPDNALPALVGGIVVAAQPRDGDPTYIRLEPPASLRAIVAIPDLRLATAEARALLPDRYTRADAVFNIQRAALLAAAFASGDLDALRIAMGDRIHQPYRAAALPGVGAALALDLPGLRGIALSGAGPSVLALADDNVEAIAAAMHEAFAASGVACETCVLTLSRSGVELREAGAHGE